ncbi:hypothetical protein Y88_0823 [Novosphingobium nitrogenifigens DSM 19370]|uniref:Uncharacterized protein n=1 Tax=Novosphingobium nitrogenifigens DSM 19370 TaxID=983920 RepID=F1Z9H7_9SPHN|nr:hypothetical protein Y88_0823 [Novosphingobium nitrogenifigens DSM 19370]
MTACRRSGQRLLGRERDGGGPVRRRIRMIGHKICKLGRQ